MELTDSVDKIVCFGHFGSMFWTNLGPIYAKMAKYDCEKASFYNLQAKTCIKRIKLSEIVDFCLFYIHLTILDLFWTNFGSVLDYLWTKFGLQYPINELLHENFRNLLDRVIFGHFGPELGQYWPKIGSKWPNTLLGPQGQLGPFFLSI